MPLSAPLQFIPSHDKHKLNNTELVEGSRRAGGPDENLISFYSLLKGLRAISSLEKNPRSRIKEAKNSSCKTLAKMT